MKAFISYKHTGEDEESLKNFISPLINKFKEIDIEAYCNLFDQDLLSRSLLYKPKDFVTDAFGILSKCDFIFVILKSEVKSEGMLMEVGYALAKNIPVVVVVRDDIKNTYMPTMGNLVIEWKDLNDLLEKISNTNFNNFKK